MRALVVEVGPEIEQLVFEICSGPEQHAIQILASKSANQPFHEWMGQGKVGDGLDFRHLQYPQIGLPLVEPIKWIVVGTKREPPRWGGYATLKLYQSSMAWDRRTWRS
jgi:hypothetical protein